MIHTFKLAGVAAPVERPIAELLEESYFAWLRRTDDWLLAAFAYDEAFGHGLGTKEAGNGYADERT
jgi:hypothetical protein